MTALSRRTFIDDARELEALLEENALLREEVLVARRASQITSQLVVEQFVKLEEILRQLENKASTEERLKETLAEKLQEEDILALIDKRQGQQKDYRFTPEIKAELIQQFILDIVSEGKTTGKQLSQRLQKRCQFILPERSIRYYVKKLGLKTIKRSLPELLTEVKKTPRVDP